MFKIIHYFRRGADVFARTTTYLEIGEAGVSESDARLILLSVPERGGGSTVKKVLEFSCDAHLEEGDTHISPQEYEDSLKIREEEREKSRKKMEDQLAQERTARAAAKESALKKLEILGLTPEEIRALL